MRYYIATMDGIPYHAQPEKGYTELQVIDAVHRYATDDARILGGIIRIIYMIIVY